MIEFENWEKERDRDRESVDFEGSLLELQISWPKHTYLTTKLLISYVFKLHNYIYKFGSVGFSVKKSSITIEPKTKKIEILKTEIKENQLKFKISVSPFGF